MMWLVVQYGNQEYNKFLMMYPVKLKKKVVDENRSV